MTHGASYDVDARRASAAAIETAGQGTCLASYEVSVGHGKQTTRQHGNGKHPAKCAIDIAQTEHNPEMASCVARRVTCFKTRHDGSVKDDAKTSMVSTTH